MSARLLGSGITPNCLSEGPIASHRQRWGLRLVQLIEADAAFEAKPVDEGCRLSHNERPFLTKLFKE